MIPRKLIFVAALLAATSSHAQTTRGGKVDFYLAPVLTGSKNHSFEGGSSAHSDTGAGLLLGYAYNFSQKAALGVEVEWSSIDYRATVQPGPGNPNAAADINRTMQTWTTRFVGTYNFLEGDFTPFVAGGLGWTFLDTNLAAGLPPNVCWHYPWSGLYCGSSAPAPTKTSFSYNAGAGLRMELGRSFVRAMINEQWVDFGGSYGTTSWTQYRIDFGVKF